VTGHRVRLAIGITLAIFIPPVLVVGGVALIRSSSPPAARPAPRTAIAASPTPGHYAPFLLGVFEHGTPQSWGPIRGFAHAVSQPQLVLLYTGIGSRFPSAFAASAHTHGAVLVIQVNPGRIPLQTIATGTYDGWLRGYARQVVRFGQPVVVGFGHEMNGSWYPWGHHHQPPATFVAAWRRIVTVFRQTGAINVTWLWTISANGAFQGLLRSYWPGARYVNWVGVDGYYSNRGSRFAHVFAPIIAAVRSLTRDPVLLSEMAIAPGVKRAFQIANLFAGIRADHLLGLVWFDVDQAQVAPFFQDWRLEGHPVAIAAFRKGASSMKGAGS
jgi:mannan endo-1,4-beta-mannosidase